MHKFSSFIFYSSPFCTVRPYLRYPLTVRDGSLGVSSRLLHIWQFRLASCAVVCIRHASSPLPSRDVPWQLHSGSPDMPSRLHTVDSTRLLCASDSAATPLPRLHSLWVCRRRLAPPRCHHRSRQRVPTVNRAMTKC